MTYILPFISALLGAGFALWVRPKKPQGMKLVLSFSGAFLLGILVLDMLPQIFYNGDKHIGIWILLGILMQIVLEFFSKGAEHGHVSKENNTRIPMVLLLSLCIHAFIEGMPLANQPHLLVGVSVHKIPIAMVIALLIWQTKTSVFRKLLLLILFSGMSPLGTWIIALQENTSFSLPIIEAIVVGVLLHISTTILFESSQGHQFNAQKLLMIFLGLLTASIL